MLLCRWNVKAFILLLCLTSSQQYISQHCSDDDFRCSNGKCIESQQQCDGVIDCPNREDEINCTCDPNEFTCEKDHSCIEGRKRCDGTNDCDDFSDELGCFDVPGQFRCNDGSCISVRLRCDGVVDCPNDGSDEKECPCSHDQWQCDHGSCIERIKRCDGRVDCPADRSDERNCFATPSFRCETGKLLPRHLRCNHQYDCPPGDYSDEKNCPCGENDFKCGNGYCIPASKHCDRTNDCQDGSDEKNCSYATIFCMASEYECSDGECLNYDLRCDGNSDCIDGSDEEHCPCYKDQFHCKNGSCINIILRCNGIKDCRPDGEDEYNCNIPLTCPPNYLTCSNGDCIAPSKQCDGRTDCPNGEDEQHCNSNGEQVCPPEYILCDGACLEPLKRCDGYEDCDNGEDELDCKDCAHQCDGKCLDDDKVCDRNTDCEDGSDELHCDFCNRPTDFRCANGECINARLRCNDVDDCGDRSDEYACNNTIFPTREPCVDQFECKNGICIDMHFVCDGHQDCIDGSDEVGCAGATQPSTFRLKCQSLEFKCDDGHCIPEARRCDNIYDCADFSDEQQCSNSGCTSNEYRCDNSQCIEDFRYCDGYRDCNDGSDEISCATPSIPQTTTYRPIYRPPYTLPPPVFTESPLLDGCYSNQWRCENGPCISMRQRCDGRIDCPYDSSDELDCPPDSLPALNLKTYPNEQIIRNGGDVVFQCRDEGPRRAPVRWVREGGRPLKPGSTDVHGRLEMFKVSPSDSGVYICQAPKYLGQPGAELRTQLTVNRASSPVRPERPHCGPTEATCSNLDCIPKHQLCDGNKDCEDGSDEDSCYEDGLCEPNQFKCANRRCVLKSWICDKEDDCGDGSDEYHCDRNPAIGGLCLSDEYTCKSEQCIPKSYHCDSQPDCLDGSDEVGCAPVHITVPPRPTHLNLYVGDTLTLVCEAVGVPTPIITWRLNWGHVPDVCRMTNDGGVGTLVCPDMQINYSGAYSCEAINNRATTIAVPDSIVVVKEVADVCPPGYFNSEARSPNDCIKCFCFGESTSCRSADLFTFNMPTPLGYGGTRLVGVTRSYNGEINIGSQPVTDEYYYRSLHNGATVTKLDTYPAREASHPYLTLPETYNGNQLTSYGGTIKYKLQSHSYVPFSDSDLALPDIIIKGQYGTLVYKQPRSQYSLSHSEVKAHIMPTDWDKVTNRGLVRATREDIMMVLDNVELILLRASINGAGVNITDFVMQSAQHINVGLGSASLVEECQCPPGYDGISCQKCAPGYVRESSGPWLGHCIVEVPTCPPGTYGDPRSGYACRPCPCPLTNRENQFAKTCHIGSEGRVVCECSPGYEGETCDYCAPGYVGNPTIPGDSCKPKVESKCNAIGTSTIRFPDECECKDNVVGRYCDRCKDDSFFLSPDFRHGCAQCFCTGVIEDCTSSTLRRTTTSVNFNSRQSLQQLKVYSSSPIVAGGATRYNAPVETNNPQQYSSGSSVIRYVTLRPTIYYWSLPPIFAGDKVTSYGGYLRYTLRHNSPPNGHSDENFAADVQLISENHLTFHYYGDVKPTSDGIYNVSVQFLEKGWQRSDGKEVQREHLLLALADVKTILVRATYSYAADVELADIVSASIETADPNGNGEQALHVEQCSCPAGYIGTSCEDCAPGYTRTDSGLYLKTCAPCQCNGHSSMCHPETGICIDCGDHTTGDYCENCKPHYERDRYNNCVPTDSGPDCRCDPRGLARPCTDGYCQCKSNVEGSSCDTCRPGTFGLHQDNPLGCIPCFCSGVVNTCYEAGDYYRIPMPAPIIGDRYGGYSLMNLRADNIINDQFVPATNESELMYIFTYPPEEELYWALPAFPGNRLLSYGGKLSLTQRFETSYQETSSSGQDVILVGVDMSIYWVNPEVLRTGVSLSYSVPLTENEWTNLETGVRVNRNDFMHVLKNLKRVLVRATFSQQIVSTAIADVSMDTATNTYNSGVKADGVEICMCPDAYTGTSCESCSPASYRDHRGRCTPCNCNGHTCQLGSSNEVVCNCVPPYTGKDCSTIGLTMELHPTISEYEGSNNYRKVSVLCQYTAHEPMSLQFHFRGEPISPAKSFNQSSFNTSGWHGSHTWSTYEWDERHEDIIECHAITAQGATLGVLVYRLTPEHDTTSTTTERGPPIYSTVSVSIKNPYITIQEVGTTVNFTCQAYSRVSSRPLNIKWTKSDGYLPQGRSYIDGGILIITNVQEADSGLYVCQASDGVSADQATVALKVPGNEITIPQVTISPSNNEYTEGDKITLRCIASGNPQPTITWLRTSANRVLPISSSVQSTFFIIENALVEDSGEYRCVGTNTGGSADRSVVIIVRPRSFTPYRDQLTISPQGPSVDEGQSTTVICTGTVGVPAGSIGWVRQDGAALESNVLSDNGVLYIENAKINNRGVYVCHSTSEDVLPVSVVISVNPVGTPPPSETPDVKVNVENLSIPSGETGIVDCSPMGYPTPSIKWTKHNSSLGPKSSQRGNSLIITDAQEEDKGYYVCEGTLRGETIANVYVYVDIEKREPPQVQIYPSGEQAVQLDGEYQLQCRVLGGVPEPDVIWSRHGDRALSPTTQILPNNILKFERVSVNDEGEYICTASNVLGHSDASSTLKVRSIPVITITPSENINVFQGDQLSVDCRANGHPLPDVSISQGDEDSRIVVPPAPGIANLRVSSASERDSGMYTCTASSAAGTIEMQFYVIVDRGDGGNGGSVIDEGSGEGEFNPDRPDQTIPMSLIEGRDGKISCNTSSSEHDVNWSRADGRRLQSNAVQINNDLIIYNTSKDDAGEYQCTLISRYTGEPLKSSYTFVEVLRPPRITLRPATQTVHPGQSPTVECVVDGDSILQIEWKPLLKSLSRRVEIRDSTLIFNQIEVEDAGEYECFARNSLANVTARAEVIVTENKNRRPSVSHDNEQHAHIGAVVHLSCNVTQPDITITWSKNGRALPRSVQQKRDGSLYIRLAQKSDSGRYVCSIQDKYGRSTKNYINLHIEGQNCQNDQFSCYDNSRCIPKDNICDSFSDCDDNSDEEFCYLRDKRLSKTLDTDNDIFGTRDEEPPLVTIEQPRRQYRVGDNVEVLCRSRLRDTKITWEKLGTNEYVHARNFGGGSMLNVPNVQESDIGTYRCTGRGSYGRSAYDDFNLDVLPSSGVPYHVNENIVIYNVTLGDDVDMTCPRNLEEPMSIEWQREFLPIDSDIRTNEPILHLSRVKESDAGTYICRVSNNRNAVNARSIMRVTGVVPRFNGDSWMVLPTLKDAYRQFNIEISLKPADGNGLVLYNSENAGREGDYLALQLLDGVPHLIIEADHDTGPITVRGDRPLTLNKWHNIRLRRNDAKVTMDVDNKVFTTNWPGRWVPLDLKQPLYIGGVPDYHQVPSQLLPFGLAQMNGYIGCISILKLGREDVNLMLDNLEKNNVGYCDVCDTNNMCLNNGLCQEARNDRGYLCLCRDGFGGVHCNSTGEACRPGVCGPGKCQDTTEGIKCACPYTHTGKRCENQQTIEYPAFTGSAYLAINTPKTGRLFRMSMTIKAASPVTNGVIMYCAGSARGQDGFTSLTIRDGWLEFRFDFGDGSGPLVLKAHKPLSANEWVEVDLTRVGPIVTMNINRTDKVEGRLHSAKKELILETPLFVGGYDDSITLNKNVGVTGGFNGCIKDVTLLGTQVNINQTIQSANVQECIKHERGDVPEDEIDCSNCRNGGYCSEDLTSCICPPGYTGFYCDDRIPQSARLPSRLTDPCNASPCRNGGTCQLDSSSRLNYTCDCPLGFAGASCQMVLELRSSVGFNGNGYLELPGNLLYYDKMDTLPAIIALAVHPTSDGVLAYQREALAAPGTGDYILLHINGGFVTLEWDLGGGPSTIVNEEVFVADGDRHQVVAQIFGDKRAIVTVDRLEKGGKALGFSNNMNADSNVYIGGIPEALNENHLPGFRGCIEQVEFMQTARGVQLGREAVAGRNAQRCREKRSNRV